MKNNGANEQQMKQVENKINEFVKKTKTNIQQTSKSTLFHFFFQKSVSQHVFG